MAPHRSVTPALAALVAFLATTVPADARNVIKQPGAHPSYSVDVEPHLIAEPFFGDPAAGLGVRGTFVLKQDGFLAKLNDSVGLGVGLDWLAPGRSSRLWVPVVMQWNFWFTESISVLAEPGGGFSTGRRSRAHPVLYGGLRWLFADSAALIVRAGYPHFSVGVSFLF